MRTVISSVNLGGIADSRYQGTDGAVADCFAMDLHTEPGVLKAQQDTKEDRASGDAIDQKAIAIIPASNDKTYFFGSGGDVWERSNTGIYTLLGSITSGSAYGEIYDAVEFNGDIYYTMQQRVGKYTPGDAWSARDDNFKTIDFDPFHPLKVLNNDLYVGSTNTVRKIVPGEAATGAATTALTLQSDYTVESFGVLRDNLIIGTRRRSSTSGKFAGFSKIFNWDTISPGWSSEQEVKEFGISAFMDFSGTLLFNAGNKGMLYSYDGVNAVRFKRIPGNWTGTNAARISKNASSSYFGGLAFGLSFEAGTAPANGIYLLTGYDAKYPSVFSFDFLPHNGDSSSVEIGALGQINSTLVFSFDAGATEGVSSVDTANKYSGAYINTMEQNQTRDFVKTVKVRVCYRELPSNTAIEIRSNVNNANPDFSGSAISSITHTDKKYVETDVLINDAYTYQIQVRLTTSGNNSPIIEQIIIDDNIATS